MQNIPPLKNFLLKTSVILLAALIGLGLGELVIRVFLPWYSPANHIYYQCDNGLFLGPRNTTLRQFTNTGEYDVTVDFNQYGFRDDKDISNSQSSDLIVIGDSYSMGHGVSPEQRYSNILEQQLNIPVYNISIPGDLEEYDALIAYADSLGAGSENLIIGFCMKNDLKKYPSGEIPCRKEESLFDSPLATWFQEFKFMLRKNSAFYFAVTSVVQQNSWLRDFGVSLGLIRVTSDIPYGRVPDQSLISSSADKLESIVKAKNAVILIIPFQALWQGEYQHEEKMIHDHFIRQLEQRDLLFLDLRHLMVSSGDPLQYYYPKDGHWNLRGHRFAAQALTKEITNSDLIQNSPDSSEIYPN